MSPTSKVSIKWQIVFSLISPLNIWAFYRIKKLQKYFLYVLAPSMVISSLLFGIGFYEMTLLDPLTPDTKYPEPSLPPNMTPIEPQVGKFDYVPYPLIGIISSVGFSAFSIYLVIIWSREWNETRN
ncbi:hypothetical protein [Nitrosopumilus sp.]|uniref:hypothetical protein n=1 Tax=Nitrosopumilus sp. TaxID=2024843 RepID=UPI00247DD5E5|nr:hypothetical protein [Nitrosopumilus sp.]MCV0431845.1 hypothetical protein [Nitrosopumilus sp.]